MGEGDGTAEWHPPTEPGLASSHWRPCREAVGSEVREGSIQDRHLGTHLVPSAYGLAPEVSSWQGAQRPLTDLPPTRGSSHSSLCSDTAPARIAHTRPVLTAPTPFHALAPRCSMQCSRQDTSPLLTSTASMEGFPLWNQGCWPPLPTPWESLGPPAPVGEPHRACPWTLLDAGPVGGSGRAVALSPPPLLSQTGRAGPRGKGETSPDVKAPASPSI